MTVEKETLVRLFRMMVRCRTFEERLQKEFYKGAVPGFICPSFGHEAIAVGACANLRPDDYLQGDHRPNAQIIAKGEDMKVLMAELYGRKTGCSRGKGGAFACINPDINSLGSNGILGAGINIAGGAATAIQFKKTDQVVLCFFGDGAANCSAAHEGINLASIWKLPVVYIISNNDLAETVRFHEATNIENLSARGVAYGIPGKTVDGCDVLAVYQAVGEAVARARKGEGPSIIECKLLRGGPAHFGDEQTYRTKEEFEEIKRRDPILNFKKKLIGTGMLTEEESERIQREALEEVDAAVQFAEKSPWPDPEDCYKDIFV
jgi:TPP-dependent pyruvate/acetoin dehydrogenase alpha subunit